MVILIYSLYIDLIWFSPSLKHCILSLFLQIVFIFDVWGWELIPVYPILQKIAVSCQLHILPLFSLVSISSNTQHIHTHINKYTHTFTHMHLCIHTHILAHWIFPHKIVIAEWQREVSSYISIIYTKTGHILGISYNLLLNVEMNVN